MKLTNAIREEIICHCLTHTFKARHERLEKARTVLADELYNLAFGEAEKIARKLPAGWLSDMTYIEISCDGFSWNGRNPAQFANHSLKLSKPRLKPRVITKEFTIQRDAPHPCKSKAEAIVQEHVALYACEQELRQKLTTLLASVTTLDKLREAWPQGSKFFPEARKPVKLPVPHELASQVNALMGAAPK